MEFDDISLSSQYKDRLEPFKIPAWTFVPGFLLIHLLVATCLPERFSPLSTIFIVVAELTAIAACMHAARRDSAARGFWLLLAGAMVFHSAAMSMDAVTEITGAPMFNHVPALSILLSMFYGVPLLVAVSFQNDRRVLLTARLIHTLLSMAIGAVIYLEIFSFLPLSGSNNASDAILMTRLFDAMDVFLAVAGTIRWAGSSQNEERRFFGVLTIFLWADGLSCAVHNRLLIRHDWIWLDLLISAPYTVLVPLILTARERPARSPSAGLVRAVRSGSPIFLASALVAAGVIETRSHFYVGLAATVFGTVGYGALNVLVQSRGFKTEEALMATNLDLEKLIDLDGLTGIANRRAFDKALAREFGTAIRTRHSVSLLMIDVDLFKDLNDAKGHVTGDEYLVRIAEALRLTLPRTSDFVARYGGEEFSAILPATDSAGAMIAAEKVRQAVADLKLFHPTASTGVITVSIGLSSFDGQVQLSPSDLTEAADRALYEAKRRGRNRCAFRPLDNYLVSRARAAALRSRL